jgi:PAS domain S-box-containing protein
MSNYLKNIENSAHDQGNTTSRMAGAYRALLDLDRDAILMVRMSDGLIMETNKVCLDLLGFTEQTISEIHFADFMVELSSVFSVNALYTSLDPGPLSFQETLWKHCNGRQIPVQASMKKIDAPGEPMMIIIARDLSEMKAKENALLASDARYFDLVDSSGEGLGIVDTDEYFTFANPAACEIFGLSPDQMIGTNLNSFLDEHAIEEIRYQTAIRKEGQKSIYELEIVRPDGNRRWIIVTATPQYDSERKFISTLGIFRDITARKLAETRLRESEQRLHEIVDITNDWIWEVDPGWKYSFVSPKVFDILGYRPEEMIGRSPFEFLLPEDVASVQEGIRGIVHQFKPLNAIVNQARHREGRLVYLETSGIAVFSEQGEYKGYRGADRDITRRKLVENELISAKEKAEESDRLKSSILANMSHELRTPLNGILGFAEILKEEISHSESGSMVDNIYNSGLRLMSTLNSIITLSQLEAGKISMSAKMTLLDHCISTVVKSLEFQYAEKNLHMSITSVKPVSIRTDEHLFNILLQQILDNAIKFTDKGGVTIETKEVTESMEEWVVVRICDTGIGIDTANYELIFQEFRQVSEGFGRKYQGSGIGLTISRKIIDLLGGKITVSSEPGSGTCFSLWLPRDAGASSLAENSRRPEIVPDNKPQSEQEQLPLLLLVEDNMINKELTTLFLHNICIVDHAPDAATAIEMVKNKTYRAILMDINLGYGKNGIEATIEIRKLPGYETIPIIAVTGYTMEDEMGQLFAAGCNKHISKPFNKQTLLKIVQESLNSH